MTSIMEVLKGICGKHFWLYLIQSFVKLPSEEITEKSKA